MKLRRYGKEYQELKNELDGHAVQRWYTLSNEGKAVIDKRVSEIKDRMKVLNDYLDKVYPY